MKYFSMFSGIGGFELGINRAFSRGNKSQLHIQPNTGSRHNKDKLSPSQEWGEHTCVGYSEIDKYAIQTYKKNFKGHKYYGSATDIVWEQVPDFNLLVGGFPCQSFSIAGKRGGFEDTRGTLFFEIARGLSIKRPELCLLENVRGLLSHDKGRTFGCILSTLSDLGYFLQWQVLNSKNHGVPQNRERVFIIGCLRERGIRQVFPLRETDKMGDGKGEGEETTCTTNTLAATYGRGPAAGRPLIADYRNDEGLRIRKDNMSPCLAASHTSEGKKDISMCPPLIIGGLQEHQTPRTDGISPCSPEAMGKGGGHTPVVVHNLQTRSKDRPSFCLDSSSQGVELLGRIRRLTPVECERLQGFPDNWTEGVSDTQRYKQCGNAVTVNVIEAIIRRMIWQSSKK